MRSMRTSEYLKFKMASPCFTINGAKDKFLRFAGLSNNAQLEMVELKVNTLFVRPLILSNKYPPLS